MTVQQLMGWLKELPPDAPVFVNKRNLCIATQCYPEWVVTQSVGSGARVDAELSNDSVLAVVITGS